MWIAGLRTLFAASNLFTGMNFSDPRVECLVLTIYLCFNEVAKVAYAAELNSLFYVL